VYLPHCETKKNVPHSFDELLKTPPSQKIRIVEKLSHEINCHTWLIWCPLNTHPMNPLKAERKPTKLLFFITVLAPIHLMNLTKEIF
jgi:hypothetical protein